MNRQLFKKEKARILADKKKIDPVFYMAARLFILSLGLLLYAQQQRYISSAIGFGVFFVSASWYKVVNVLQIRLIRKYEPDENRD